MTLSLTRALDEVQAKIRAAGRVALFLDFDGTLSPIVEDPSAARLDPEITDTLRRLAQHPFIVTTVMSGRAVEDLYSRIRVPGLIYAGNHGLEIFGRNLRFVEPSAARRRNRMRQLSESLAARLDCVPGAVVEDKGLTTSVHFRQASDSDVEKIEDAVRASVALAGAWFRMNSGRKVLEIVPRANWHKGAAVNWITRQLGDDDILAIYLGDDASDEDAFAVLPTAITVKVGGMPVTCAQYRLPDPAGVHNFLLWIEGQLPRKAA